jgi:hypothetical protein
VTKPRACWVARSQPDFPVSREPLWSHLATGPRSLASPGSSSHELHALFRVSTAPNLPRTSPCSAPPLGFLSPSRHQHEESTCRPSIPSSTYGPPAAFLTPSTVYSSSRLAGLFHPATTSEIHLSGGCSRRPARTPHRRPVPSCRSRLSPAAELPRRLRLHPRRLQGLDPNSGPKRPTE